MTFVGKVLVVLQVVLSVCFMAFAGAVYTTQTNWKVKTANAEKQLGDVQKQLGDLQAEFQTYKTDTTAQINQATNSANQFQAQANGLQQQVARLTTELNTTKTEAATYSAQAQLTSTEARDRRVESIEQRKVNSDLHTSTNDLIAKLRQTEDALFNVSVEQQQTQEKQAQLLTQLGDMRRRLVSLGVDPDAAPIADTMLPPPLVVGQVLDTKKADRSGNEFIEISVGSDDGLLEGHNLFVYRTGLEKQGEQPRYLGKIQIVHVTPDRAVGAVVQRAKNGVIEKGDNVSTKL